MTLNASEVSLYFVKKGEKPCWKVITSTQIRGNFKTGKVEEEVLLRNELYVPSESITPGYELDVIDKTKSNTAWSLLQGVLLFYVKYRIIIV
jgi:hypothetical protein